MTKTIVWEEWIAQPDDSEPKARRLLSHFDLQLLRRGKKAPARVLPTIRKRRARA